jgi:hypothetical protein
MTVCLDSIEIDPKAMSARVDEAALIDQTLIDGVLAEFDRIAGNQ